MRTSSDHILTSHAGSLPRPDDLIEAWRKQVTNRALARKAHSVGGGCRAPAEGDRHRRSGRRRVRQVDGAAGQLRLVVELLVEPPRRARSARPQPLRDGAAALAPGPGRADELWRPPRPHPVRRGLWRSRIPALRPGRGRPRRSASRRSAIPGTTRSGPTSPISRRRLQAAGVEEGFMTAVAPGSASRIGNSYYKTRRGVPLRLRRGDARGVQGDPRCRPDPAARRSGDRRELGHDQPRADGRGVQEIHDGPGRGAEPRDPRPAAGPHPLSSVLGQLARAAHHRHRDARHRRCDAGGQRAAPIRSRPAMSATSTNGRSGRTSNCPTTS